MKNVKSCNYKAKSSTPFDQYISNDVTPRYENNLVDTDNMSSILRKYRAKFNKSV